MLGSEKLASIFNAGLRRAQRKLICIVNLQEGYFIFKMNLTSGYSKGRVLWKAAWKCLSRGMALSHWQWMVEDKGALGRCCLTSLSCSGQIFRK